MRLLLPIPILAILLLATTPCQAIKIMLFGDTDTFVSRARDIVVAKCLGPVLDMNKYQLSGATKDILNMDSVADKWKSFGWAVAHGKNDIKNPAANVRRKALPTVEQQIQSITPKSLAQICDSCCSENRTTCWAKKVAKYLHVVLAVFFEDSEQPKSDSSVLILGLGVDNNLTRCRNNGLEPNNITLPN